MRTWDQDKRQKHLISKGIKSQKLPDPTRLPRTDWDFTDIPSEELAYCVVYEYVRDSKRMKQQINTVLQLQKELRELTTEQWADLSEEERHTFLLLQKMYQNIKSVPQSKYSETGPEIELPGWEGTFLLECGFDVWLFQDKPWIEIPPQERKARLTAYFGGDYQNPQAFVDAAFTDATVNDLRDAAGNLQNLRNKTPVSFHVIRVAWDCTDDTIKQSFAKWLKTNEPADRTPSDRRGTNKAREHLYQLAAYRLLNHYTWNEAATLAVEAKLNSSGTKRELYSNQGGWINARKAAVARRELMEEHKFDDLEYLGMYHRPSIEIFFEERFRTARKQKADSVRISMEDISDLPSFAAKLKQKADSVSGFLISQFSSSALEALAAYKGSASNPEPLQSVLVTDLNKIIETQTVYDMERFKGIRLRLGTLKLVQRFILVPAADAAFASFLKKFGGQQRAKAKTTSTPEIPIINRLLLEEAYPQELRRSPTAMALASSM